MTCRQNGVLNELVVTDFKDYIDLRLKRTMKYSEDTVIPTVI
jgi:retron-type reverse transcriptase